MYITIPFRTFKPCGFKYKGKFFFYQTQLKQILFFFGGGGKKFTVM